ncbi:MAG: hypothetical protein ACE10K_11720, partial [Rhodothermales bacterium]
GFAAVPPPLWEQAFAVDEAHVALAWRTAGADSVIIYRSAPGQPLDPIATTTANEWVDETSQGVRYVLRGWFQGVLSPLSEERAVRPHRPAIVASATYPDPTTIELLFTEPLDSQLRAGQFALDIGGTPATLILGRSNQAVTLRFDGDLAARTDTLRWTGVHDAEGTPVGQTALATDFPPGTEGGLFVAEWEILGAYTFTLTFSEALDPDFATDVANYRLEPSGRVVAAMWTPERPAAVTLEVEGRVVGATGLETSLVVVRMRSASGRRLAPEGHTLSLTQAADNLAGVYVFPNPYRDGEHQPRVMVAGLPPNAIVRIFSVQGEPVKRLEEHDGDGGVAWDLTDENGQPVPSGIYLVRVEAPDQKAVLRKAAIIR